VRVDDPTTTLVLVDCGESGRGLRPQRRSELGRFCSIAMGSASELEYHLLLARDLTLLKGTDYAELARQTTEVKRMLTGLIQKLTADR
jgi:four helix bundle protein